MDAGVDAVWFERLAAIRAPIQRDTQSVDSLFVVGIRAHDGEIEGTFLQTVDALPGFAAIRRFIDAASLIAARTLQGLHVGALAPEPPGEGASRRRGNVLQGNLDLLLDPAALIHNV